MPQSISTGPPCAAALPPRLKEVSHGRGGGGGLTAPLERPRGRGRAVRSVPAGVPSESFPTAVAVPGCAAHVLSIS